jgi:hypothetical protein
MIKTRKRSNAIAFTAQAQELTTQDKNTKHIIYSMNGLYQNFNSSYVKHSEIDKKGVLNHIGGFVSMAHGGVFTEVLLKYLGMYLKPEDFINLKLVCKGSVENLPKIQ